MPTQPLSDEVLREAWQAVRDSGSVSGAAKASGIPRNTLDSRLEQAMRRLDLPHPTTTVVSPTPFSARSPPSKERPLDELLRHRRAEAGRAVEYESGTQLIRIDIKTPGPVGFMVFGDPHIDNPGCDFNLLESHLQIAAKRREYIFAGNIGDVQDNWVGRLEKLYAETTVSSKEIWSLVEWMFTLSGVHWAWLVRGNHDCVSMDTEALTARGWMGYADLRDDDLVLSMDRATGRAVWSPILKKFSRPNEENMVSIKGRQVDMLVTANHRILHQKRDMWKQRWIEEWVYETPGSMPAKFRIPCGVASGNPEYEISDDWLTIVGWLLTDGGITRPGRGRRMVEFYQSKECPSLERGLLLLGLQHSVQTRQRGIRAICGRELIKEPKACRTYRLTADSSATVLAIIQEKGVVPEWTHQLSDRQFEVLLNAIVEGDGSWDGVSPESKQCAIIHGTKRFLDSLQILAITHGWRATLSVAREKDYRLSVAKRTEWMANRGASIAAAPPVSEVWCMTVPHGNFMMRRNGRACFTGNCWSGRTDPLDWISKAAHVGVDQPVGARLAFHHPNGAITRMHARHDFSGHSQFNPLHALKKEVLHGFRDHIIVAGHRHIGADARDVNGEGMPFVMCRVSGYKVSDSYRHTLGLKAKPLHPAALIIVDPDEPDTSNTRVWCAPTVEEGSAYLDFKRKRYESKPPSKRGPPGGNKHV